MSYPPAYDGPQIEMKGMFMKIRSDSPFAALSEVEQMMILDVAEIGTIQQVLDHMLHNHPTLDYSIPALKRFIRRLREENLREEVEEADDAMEGLAKAAKSGRTRDGVLEAMRRKIYAEALEAKDSMQAMMVFNMMKAEQEKDRSLALEERRTALEEENSKQEWKRKELEDARSALKLLPRIAEILMGAEGTDAERVAEAREVLGAGGAKLLIERTGG
jgi:hypothetical protein